MLCSTEGPTKVNFKKPVNPIEGIVTGEAAKSRLMKYYNSEVVFHLSLLVSMSSLCQNLKVLLLVHLISVYITF